MSEGVSNVLCRSPAVAHRQRILWSGSASALASSFSRDGAPSLQKLSRMHPSISIQTDSRPSVAIRSPFQEILLNIQEDKSSIKVAKSHYCLTAVKLPPKRLSLLCPRSDRYLLGMTAQTSLCNRNTCIWPKSNPPIAVRSNFFFTHSFSSLLHDRHSNRSRG